MTGWQHFRYQLGCYVRERFVSWCLFMAMRWLPEESFDRVAPHILNALDALVPR